MPSLLYDVRFALRSMAKRPGISLLMVATLAVGLAANGLIFNILDAMVLRPFDFPNTSRLVRIWETAPIPTGSIARTCRRPTCSTGRLRDGVRSPR